MTCLKLFESTNSISVTVSRVPSEMVMPPGSVASIRSAGESELNNRWSHSCQCHWNASLNGIAIRQKEEL